MLGALMSAVALLSGCVSAKYKFAKPESTPPPVVLSLAAAPAALGATVPAATPEGTVQLTIPPGSSAGRQLRMKGRGIPGSPPGDLYAVLSIALPPADTEAAREAYRTMAKAFDFNPR